MENYEKLGKVGSGSYGDVYKAKDRRNNTFVALKKVKLDNKDEGIPSTTIREISVLRELEHNHIVRLLEVFNRESKLYLAFEFMDRDLKKYLDETSHLPVNLSLVKSYMHQILQAIDFCHRRRILHRDLKPHNLLINKDGLIKIADFGLARVVSLPLRVYTHEVVTLWYRAPEILLGGQHYSTSVDIWSIGCIFAELISGQPLFPGDSEIDQIYNIFRIMGTPTEENWPGVGTLPNFNSSFPKWNRISLQERVTQLDVHGLDLLEKMLSLDPSKRISAKKALKHPYFDDFQATLF